MEPPNRFPLLPQKILNQQVWTQRVSNKYGTKKYGTKNGSPKIMVSFWLPTFQQGNHPKLAPPRRPAGSEPGGHLAKDVWRGAADHRCHGRGGGGEEVAGGSGVSAQLSFLACLKETLLRVLHVVVFLGGRGGFGRRTEAVSFWQGVCSAKPKRRPSVYPECCHCWCEFVNMLMYSTSPHHKCWP